jgi:phosphoserine aminotransferase
LVSFYPGPSRVYDDIPKYVADAHIKGVLSLNHRSEEFMELSRQVVTLLRDRLGVPADFDVFFATSATECWEIIAQSLVIKESVHLHSGAFGEKWFDYTHRIKPAARALPFDREVLLKADLNAGTGDVICITQNETSNGTQVSVDTIRAIGKSHPAHIIAVDATSSMAGINLDFTAADVWFASVQKCFGLPAGLSVMICSQRAMKRMTEVGERAHYNSLLFVKEMMDKYQTNCTPNVLGIYLLMRVLKKMPPISRVDNVIRKRAHDWEQFIANGKRIAFVVQNKEARSSTVLALSASEDNLALLKEKAKRKGYLLGEGYGALKKSSFRIANFPAIRDEEIRDLMKFLRNYI